MKFPVRNGRRRGRGRRSGSGSGSGAIIIAITTKNQMKCNLKRYVIFLRIFLWSVCDVIVAI